MLLTFGLLVGCILCYTFQGFFGQLFGSAYQGRESDATPVFSCIYGLIVGVSVLAVALGFRFEASLATWCFGLANGLILFLYNLGVINAARTGPFSIQSIFRLFGGVVGPMLFAVLFWGDQLTAVQFAGIVVMLASFVMINADGLAFKDVKKGYVGWVALLFIVNGIYGVLMDCQQRVMQQTQSNEMIVVTFLTSSLISLVSLAVSRRQELPQAFRMSGKAWLSALGGGTVATLAVCQFMVLLTRMSSAVFFTVENGMVLVLSVVLSAVVLKEKLSRNTLIGIAMSVISLVLLSL